MLSLRFKKKKKSNAALQIKKKLSIKTYLTCKSAIKRKKALAALRNCEYRNRGRKVRTLYLAVLKTDRTASRSQGTKKTTDKNKTERKSVSCQICQWVIRYSSQHLCSSYSFSFVCALDTTEGHYNKDNLMKDGCRKRGASIPGSGSEICRWMVGYWD